MGVSVIIPCRNQAATLARAVKSAFAAGANEVLVFDDASTDDTQNVCFDLQAIYRGGFFFMDCGIHTGVIFARNFLIKQAKYDWIIPLDADDELLNFPKDANRIAFYYGDWVEHYENGNEERFSAPPAKMLNRKPFCHATMMFTKEAWQKAGGYDPDFFYGEDYAFQCALVNVGYAPFKVDPPFYKRYVGNNARTDKAIQYWPIIQEMAREKYPSIFT